ncbi:unnamed protein product [Brugia pahangi]|uniref:Secreted protein n=1 Tax=Brugia pahangi TaxID=6280 RepID=A0A0N4TAA3_BRUPA|nr:unnamed protein product [Brugia pahangi]
MHACGRILAAMIRVFEVKWVQYCHHHHQDLLLLLQHSKVDVLGLSQR